MAHFFVFVSTRMRCLKCVMCWNDVRHCSCQQIDPIALADARDGGDWGWKQHVLWVPRTSHRQEKGKFWGGQRSPCHVRASRELPSLSASYSPNSWRERERASLSGRSEDWVLLTTDARCLSLVNGKICMHISAFSRSQDSLLQSSIPNVKM